MSITTPTPSSSRESASLERPTTSSSSGTARMSHRPSSPLRIRADTAARSARACGTVTPGFRRATALM
jgi:hypothetical protein